MSTAKQFNIGVKMIVLSNEEQDMVAQWQNIFYEDRYSHTHSENPNTMQLADAMGIKLGEWFNKMMLEMHLSGWLRVIDQHSWRL
jgi:thiamine pyrophosphate-dependent acetolactate synthase large subunit-like protein